MKTRCNLNILFLFNAVIVTLLSIGAAYFMLIGMILFGMSIEDAISAGTQNYAMIGLWLIYFTSIVYVPILRTNRGKKIKITYVVGVISSIIFVLYIMGLLQCWEATILKNFGMDYNHRIRCLNEN